MKYLKSFEKYSENNTVLNLEEKEIERTIPDIYLPLKEELEKFSCNNNSISELPYLPQNITYMDCSRNKIKELPSLPSKLEELYCYENRLSILPELPKTLIKLTCWKNNLTTLPTLPESLKYLDFDNCYLEILPILPDGLEFLFCNKNNWKEPIPYKYYKKYLNQLNLTYNYTDEQLENFRSIEFQKEFLENNPSRYEDFIPVGYAVGIKELFPEIFSAHDLGL